MTSNSIGDVSGTAYFVAHYRALESQQTTPLFFDPFAAQLAGERGPKIMAQLPSSARVAWVVSLRTAILDRFIEQAVNTCRFDTVVSLGAGLDTRAFRLALPERLRWLEVDTPEIIAHKCRVLNGTPARCAWEPIIADLSVDAVRRHTLRKIAEDSGKVLVLSEGLLEYLDERAVAALARELHELPSFHTWLLNLYGDLVLGLSKRWRTIMARENARIRFTPAAGAGFFSAMGWREVAHESMVERAIELERMPLGSRLAVSALLRFAGPTLRERVLRAAQVVHLERAS